MDLKDMKERMIQAVELNTMEGARIGTEAAIKHFEHYRKVVFLCLLFLLGAAMYGNKWLPAGVILLGLWFHVFLNQIWWKLCNLEEALKQQRGLK